MSDSRTLPELDPDQKSDDRITDILRDMIANGRFEESDKLTESGLSRLLGLSRTPVRAALKVLAAEGVLSKLPGRGYHLRKFSEHDRSHALAVRAILEALAAERLATIGLDDQNRQRLEKSLTMTETVVRRGILDDESVEAFAVANMIFHRTIMSASGNPFILDCISRLAVLPNAQLGAVHPLAVAHPSMERLAVSHQQHIIIKQAIEKKETGRAFAIMREHIGYSDEYHQLFGGNQLAAPPH